MWTVLKKAARQLAPCMNDKLPRFGGGQLKSNVQYECLSDDIIGKAGKVCFPVQLGTKSTCISQPSLRRSFVVHKISAVLLVCIGCS
jgi:hypothetical protein